MKLFIFILLTMAITLFFLSACQPYIPPQEPPQGGGTGIIYPTPVQNETQGSGTTPGAGIDDVFQDNVDVEPPAIPN
jgi:hypothetical protein